MSIREWIHKGRELGASDLHAEAGTPLFARVRGELRAIGEPIAAAELTRVGHELIGGDAWSEFLARGSADVSLATGGIRCRVSLFRTLRGFALAIRLLAPAVSDLRACNLHPDLGKLVENSTGLIVISGPTGSGKSTTLAALVEEVNGARARHVITLESPIEYVFANRRSFIRQREIPTHSPSYEQAIIDALRENPDLLVVSEMRSPETMRLTLNAAETGHLVLATLHSSTCAEALTRICMSFPAEIQSSIRAQLADCLVGVVCQRLDYLEHLHLRVPRCEVLLGSTAARGTIRAGQLSQIGNVIQSGGEDGMWTFDRYQRWMDSKRDWVRPQPPSASERAEPLAVSAPTRHTPGPPRTARTARTEAPNPNEITIDEDLDQAELAELARKIGERAP
jgi:twitching motility protein PilT